MDGSEATMKADPVGRALADIRRASTRLVKLLGHADELVRRRAAAVLAVIDPPPIAALADVLVQSGDGALRLEVVAALGRIAEGEEVRVAMALIAAFPAIKDPDVRLAIVQTIMRMKQDRELAAQAAGAGPAPPAGDPPPGTTGPGEGDGAEGEPPAGRRRRPGRGP